MLKTISPKNVYFIHAFWLSFAFSVIFTINMVFQVEMALLSPLQLVLVGSALEVSAFIFEIPTGIVADVYSRRLSVIIGIFITGVAYLIQAIPNFAAIAFASGLWGLGFTFTSGAHQAWITDELGVKDIGEVFIRARQFGRIGGLAGIPVSVLLARQGLQVPIFAGGLIILGLGLFLVFFMREENFHPTPVAERETWKTMRGVLLDGVMIVRKQPVLKGFLLIGLFVGLYSEGFDRLWTAHFLENFTFPAIFGLDIVGWFGLIRVADSLLGITFNEVLIRKLEITSMFKSVRLLQGLYGLMIASLAVLALTQNFTIALLFLLIFDVCRGLTFPIQDTWTNQFIDSKVRATVLSLQSQVDALGQMSGGPVIGSVGNLLGIRAAMTLASTILLPVVPIYQRILNQSGAVTNSPDMAEAQ